jgi:hypothetical protein
MVVLSRMYDKCDFAGTTGASGLICTSSDLWNICHHEALHNRTRTTTGNPQIPGTLDGSTGLMIHELTPAVFSTTLCELCRINYIHSVGPAVMGLLNETILVVALWAVRWLVATAGTAGTVSVCVTEKTARFC